MFALVEGVASDPRKQTGDVIFRRSEPTSLWLPMVHRVGADPGLPDGQGEIEAGTGAIVCPPGISLLKHRDRPATRDIHYEDSE